MANPITIHGVTYESNKAAERALGLSFGTIKNVVQSAEKRGISVDEYLDTIHKKQPPGIPKTVTIHGVTYESLTAAGRALGMSSGTICWVIRRVEKLGISVDQYLDTFHMKQRFGIPKTVTIHGVTYPSMKKAARDIGIPQETLKTYVAKHGTSGSALDKAVTAHLNRGYHYNGRHFLFIRELVEYVDNPFVTLDGIRKTLPRGEHLGAYVKHRIALQRRLVVGGKQYKSVREFYEEHGLTERVVGGMFRNGNSLQAIAEHLQLTEKIEKRDFMDGPVSGRFGSSRSKPVRMSGWVWASRSAFVAYYFGAFRSEVFKELADADSAAEAMLVHLCDLYRWKKLTVTNRLTPELEVQKPEWCHPINKDAREEPVSRTDTLATPDWSGSPTHAFYEMGEDSELIKTAKKMLAEAET